MRPKLINKVKLDHYIRLDFDIQCEPTLQEDTVTESHNTYKTSRTMVLQYMEDILSNSKLTEQLKTEQDIQLASGRNLFVPVQYEPFFFPPFLLMGLKSNLDLNPPVHSVH